MMFSVIPPRVSSLAILIVFLVTGVGCTAPRLRSIPVHQCYAHLGACTLNNRGLSSITVAALERAGAPAGRRAPEEVEALRWVTEYAVAHPQDGAVQQALLEKTIAVAQTKAEKEPGLALALYLTGLRKAEPLVRQVAPEDWPFLFHLNQFATARAVELLGRGGWPTRLQGLGPEDEEIGVTIAVPGDASLVDPRDLETLVAVDAVHLSAFRRHVRQDGLGAPFIAETRRPEDEERRAYYPPGGLYRPVTARFRFTEEGDVNLAFHDVLKESRVSVGEGDREQWLAADFSAAWARQVDKDPNNRALLGMLRPGKTNAYMGLTFTEPFRPDAIPVIFVHGLASNGATWDETINGLLADPEIRRRYQFWIYQYPSGYPFIYPAANLRRTLREVREMLDPDQRQPALERMVLVGHSMGGLISSAQIRRTDDAALGGFFKKPLDQLGLDPSTEEELREFLYLDPSGQVRRVIFVATPHRGSTIADSWIGRMAARLIEMPTDLLTFDIASIVQELTDTGLSLIDVATNSVKRLQYANPALKTLVELPVDPRVTVHSIVGDRGLGNAPDSSDGVVSYQSSHLATAASEMVVPARHSAHRHPEAIEEIRRILILHLQESARADEGGR